MTTTVRVRASSGQKNYQVDPTSRLSDFIVLLSREHGLPAGKLAGRLYKDFQYKDPFFTANFGKETPISQFLKHGQLIFLRLAKEEETIQIDFEDRVRRMSHTEL